MYDNYSEHPDNDYDPHDHHVDPPKTAHWLEYNNDTLFEHITDGSYILQKGDRMRRTNAYSASTMSWFELAEYDVGKLARYFHGGGFAVERRKHLNIKKKKAAHK